MGERASSLDRITELPDFILHHILSFLSIKDAAQTCLISKRWLDIWETFPILDGNECFFGRYLDITNPKELGLPKDERRNIYNQRVTFMSSIDEKLQHLIENDLRLKKFRLNMTLLSIGLAPHVDRWMDMVTDLSVQELELRLTVGKRKFYTLPSKVLTSQSLTNLSLKSCLLSHFVCGDAVKSCSLVELHLEEVCIDEEAIENLVSSIPSMEVFSLKKCVGFSELKLHGHNKLKKMVYHSHKDFTVKKFSIIAPNLEELDFLSLDKDKMGYETIINAECRNLKRLSLCGISIDAKCLEKTISSFPLFEHLLLGRCVMKQEVLKLSSAILKELYIYNCTNLVEADFDIPKLHIFQYHGKNMPRLSTNDVAGNRIAELPVHLKNMDSSWFLKLNDFLRYNIFQDLTLSITARPDNKFPFNAEDFMAIQLPAPFELRSMKLVMHAFTTINYGGLLNGLLWNLRPKILSLELNYYSPTYLKGLLKSLVCEEEPYCCCSEKFVCWRHSLKDITVAYVKGFRIGILLDLITLSSVNDFVDNWATEAKRIVKSYGAIKGEVLSFNLSWGDCST